MYYEKVGEEEDKTTRKRPGNSYDLFKIIFWITMNPLCKYPVQKERASALELGRFQNYSISILWLELYSISILVNFGKYSKPDFFTISILKNLVKIVDFSILRFW